MMKRRRYVLHPDRGRGYYYVSIINGSRCLLALGPFRYRRHALRLVRHVRRRAEDYDSFAHFYAYGTVRLADGNRRGRLNADFGMEG